MPVKSKLIKLITIPEVFDDCFLYFAQYPTHIPFKIKRVYCIIGAKTDLTRGYHVHKKNRQIIFCIQGSIKLILDNGKKNEEIVLDKPNIGVLLEKMIWHKMTEFKKDTILLVLASEVFNEKDYIRDYEKFKRSVSKVS